MSLSSVCRGISQPLYARYYTFKDFSCKAFEPLFCKKNYISTIFFYAVLIVFFLHSYNEL